MNRSIHGMNEGKQPLLQQEEAAFLRGATLEDAVTDELRDLTHHSNQGINEHMTIAHCSILQHYIILEVIQD